VGDRERSKVPSLRGVVARAPYFHNGIAANFDEVVRRGRTGLPVMGGRSYEVSPVWQQRQDLLAAWIDRAEPKVVADRDDGRQ
jgi:hypothetical protein